MELAGKVALVTGSATGIGRAIALRLAQAGVGVVINYSRSEQEATETLAEVASFGVPHLLHKAEVSSDQQVRAMVQETIGRLGRLDILVNNAGTTNFVSHDDLEGLLDEYWDRAMNVNVKGMFYASRAAASELRKNKGCIVNITSVAGLTGLGSSIAYSASKAAAISVTKSLARVLAPEVRVNSIAPGVVNTRWVEGQEEHVRRLGAGTPLGRVATPEDVAEMTYGLIVHGDFVTGQTLTVDGGMFI